MTRRYRLDPYPLPNRTAAATGSGCPPPRVPGALLHAQDGASLRPVALELVVVALGRGEHVDDHAAVVEQDPVRLRGPLATERPDTLVAERPHDAVRDGADLALRATRADDERVGEGRELAQVEEHDVGRLLVLRELDDPPRQVERRAVGRRGRLLAMRETVRARAGGGDRVGHVVSVLQ